MWLAADVRRKAESKTSKNATSTTTKKVIIDELQIILSKTKEKNQKCQPMKFSLYGQIINDMILDAGQCDYVAKTSKFLFFFFFF